MSDGPIGDSPNRWARIAGVCYLSTIILGIFAAVVSNPGLAGLTTAATVVGTLAYVAVTWLLYELFKPVARWLSLVASLFSYAGCAITLLGILHLPTPAINSLVFFGCYCLLLGYLIVRSTFMPRIIGMLVMLAGIGWLTFLSPRLIDLLNPYYMVTGLIGEGSLTVWLLVFGVDAARWKEQASAAR